MNISYYIENAATDKVNKVNGVSVFGTPLACGGGFVGMTIGGTFYTMGCEANPSGPQDFCIYGVPTGTTWIVEFKRADNSTYTKPANPFAGAHPKPRNP